MSGAGIFRWWDMFFLIAALGGLANIHKWRKEIDKDKRAGNDLADVSRGILWEDARAFLLVIAVWAATFIYRVLA
jgi:hypothetical protein